MQLSRAPVTFKAAGPLDEADKIWLKDGPVGAVESTGSRSTARTRSPLAVGMVAKGAPGAGLKQTLYSPAGTESWNCQRALESVICAGDAAQPATTEYETTTPAPVAASLSAPDGTLTA
jgi:hypothetical protein